MVKTSWGNVFIILLQLENARRQAIEIHSATSASWSQFLSYPKQITSGTEKQKDPEDQALQWQSYLSKSSRKNQVGMISHKVSIKPAQQQQHWEIIQLSGGAVKYLSSTAIALVLLNAFSSLKERNKQGCQELH